MEKSKSIKFLQGICRDLLTLPITEKKALIVGVAVLTIGRIAYWKIHKKFA